jgi:hypothetical protein
MPNNSAIHTAIPNYGERRLAGEAMSTSFVESAVNQTISGKRHVRLCTEGCQARTYTAP